MVTGRSGRKRRSGAGAERLTVSPPARFLRRFIAACALAVSAAAAPGAQAASVPTASDPRHLDELAQDVARFQEAVRGYRSAASTVIRRAYADKIRTIRGKYEPMISLNEREERERRLDAIAMFEAFLRKYPSDKRWTPDAMFRLAELYYEKSSDEFLSSQEAYTKALDSPNPPTGEPPRADYTNTVELYRRLLTDFPNYRLLDAAYYLLGFCLEEMGRPAEARQAMLALTCANQYKPLDPPPPEPAGGATTIAMTSAKSPLVDKYAECRPVRKDSKFLPEAWTRVGEMHFEAGELPLAISAYGRVLEFKDSAYYDKALYKLAWSYYRDNRFPEAIRGFDNLVKYADQRKAGGDKFGSELRPEAVQYLGISFSEPDWDGDTAPDAETGLQRADRFYKGREKEPHVKEVYQRLGDIYFDSTKYGEAIAVYHALLSKWPNYAEAPRIQARIVTAYERDRNLEMAAREREVLGRNYAKGSEWARQNQDNPDALAEAQQLAEDALLIAATNVHMGAQACNKNDPTKAAECKRLYATAAELYEKYLAAYPNSKNAYEYSFYYAEALYYSGRLPQAINAYAVVRDSNLDNRFQQDAALRIIKAHEDIITEMKTSRQIEEPPIPDEKNTPAPVVPIAMPEVYQRYVQALDWYANNLRDERVADLRYAAAVSHLRYRNWPEARGRLAAISSDYCSSKPEIGFRAFEARMKTFFIDFNIKDEEQQDCALGRLLQITDQFAESACGRNPAGAEYLARANQLRASIKTSVVKKRLDIALENEERGTDKQLVQCRDGVGGIALVTGSGPTPAGTAPGTAKPGGPAKLSTEVDVGLALDLIDLVTQNPKDQDAASNLNNACVIYEKLYQYGEATRCYERLAREYPDDKLAREAVWNASRNHYRFFNFDQAVDGFLKVATDPKFADYEHRKDALAQAASLLDNDQQYARAAQMYRRYADAIPERPRDAAESHLAACTAYEKARDSKSESQCLRDLIGRFRGSPEAAEFVVGGYLKQAAAAEKTGDKKTTMAAYQRVRDEFLARRLPAPSPAAAAAAKAEYLLLEERFNALKNRPLTLVGEAKRDERTLKTFLADAKRLQEDYARVYEYKDATWSLASALRRGDIYYELAQKLLKSADNPPPDVMKQAKRACRLDPSLCGVAETEYKDAMLGQVTPVEDEAKRQWRATLETASKLNVTNEYVKKARENLSKYLPEEFPFVKDERPQIEYP